MEVLDYLTSNGAELLLALMGIASIIVKKTPSIKDDKVFGYIDDILRYFVKNKVKDNAKKVKKK